MSLKYRLFGLVFLIGLVLDQLTKLSIVERFRYGERLVVIPGIFDLTHVRNPGGAFSLFADGPFEWRMTFFVGATALAIVLLLVFLTRHEREDWLTPVALGFVMAGAVGNLIDRIAYGEVIDFIDVHLWGGYTWPTFNLADSAIVLGVSLLLVEVFVSEEGTGEGERPLAD
ncbi:MAG: signal peptidase II [Myxococcales bacterium]|nr:signal peptidase II [Myxococcales bacterium]HIL79916.1 signal peptidase II [Myxococcales bacterium]